jgi:ribosome-binding protein aMBF1 (putative translation factor)
MAAVNRPKDRTMNGRIGTGAATVGRKRKGPPRDVRGTLSAKFGQHLEQLATDAGLSADAFAHAIGKSNQSVWKYFRGIHLPHVDDWPKIAKVLKLKSIRELIPDIKSE